jgi:hypothetical protein
MCQKLGWQPSWDFQKFDMTLTGQDKWNLLEVMPVSLRRLSVASKNDLDDQNLLLQTVYN